MGILRDAIGSAMGAGQVNNGLNGPKLPFMNNIRKAGRNSQGYSHSRHSSGQPPRRYSSDSDYDDGRYGQDDYLRRQQDDIYREGDDTISELLCVRRRILQRTPNSRHNMPTAIIQVPNSSMAAVHLHIGTAATATQGTIAELPYTISSPTTPLNCIHQAI